MSYDPNARRDTPLARKLGQRIRREGPITVQEYVQACLHDPEHGYYRRRTAIGRSGDFVTAPEISQVFGELIGLWCAVVWQQMGSPSQTRIVELGPGRGTLLKDALRASRALPAFRSAISLHLVESSPVLADLQRSALADAHSPLHWHGALSDVPAGPAIVLGNEFLDTMRVRQLIRVGEGWRERGVGLDAAGKLCFVEMGPAEPGAVGAGLSANAPQGTIDEIPEIAELGYALIELARRSPLAAIFMDYGHVEPLLGDTLQAVRNHRFEHPLASPGEADLTSQVRFRSFELQIMGDATRRQVPLTVDGPVTQAEFLGFLGIVERASRLMAANPVQAAEIEAGVARIMAPNGMGTRYKAIGIRSSDLPPLPGFPVSIG